MEWNGTSPSPNPSPSPNSNVAHFQDLFFLLDKLYT